MKFFSILTTLVLIPAGALFDDMNRAIENVWTGLVQRNQLYAGPFLIHRPFSETPNDAVSEGIGYGLIIAMYCNDQEHFDMLLEGADATMWNGQYYDWRVDAYGNKMALGGATDAEQDIAAMLIMAQSRVDSGEWMDYHNGYYRQRAVQILSNLWQQGIVDGILRPGYQWGGTDFVNVGYFAPAWYRLFQQFDPDPSHDWGSVVETSYAILNNSPGIANGLVPDWMTPIGGFTTDVGYNAYGGGAYMYKDAIRVLWRVGTDFVWNRDNRARDYIEKANSFLWDVHGGITGANFFDMDGGLLPITDEWIFDGGKRTRPRREHSPMTVGMWSIPCALAGNETQKKGCAQELLRLYEPNATYWGLTTGNETILQNEMYFDQFLALFGALFFSGRWVNLV